MIGLFVCMRVVVFVQCIVARFLCRLTANSHYFPEKFKYVGMGIIDSILTYSIGDDRFVENIPIGSQIILTETDPQNEYSMLK